MVGDTISAWSIVGSYCAGDLTFEEAKAQLEFEDASSSMLFALEQERERKEAHRSVSRQHSKDL
jgi:hypothetical protein